MKTFCDAISAGIVGAANSTLPLHRFAYEYANCKSRHAAALLIYNYNIKIDVDENEAMEIRDQLVQLKVILVSLSHFIKAELSVVLVGSVLLSRPLLGLQLIPFISNAEMLSNTLRRMLSSTDKITIWTALCASRLINDTEVIKSFLKHTDISIRRCALMNSSFGDMDSLIQSAESLELLPVLVDLFIKVDDNAFEKDDLHQWSNDLLTKMCNCKERDSLLIVKLLKLFKKSDESCKDVALDLLCSCPEPEIKYELATMISSTLTGDILLNSFLSTSEPKIFDEFVTRKWLERVIEGMSPEGYFESAKKCVPFALNVHSEDFQTFLFDSLRTKCGEERANTLKALLPSKYRAEAYGLSEFKSFEQASELLNAWVNASIE